MKGKKASKSRILISMFKKYKKPHRRKGFVILEDGFVFIKENPRAWSYLMNPNRNWKKRERMNSKEGSIDNKKRPKVFYSSGALQRFVYEIKEGYELSIH